MTFEVGKKYRHKTWKEGFHFTVLYMGETGVLARYSDHREAFRTLSVLNYEEYHEPKIEKVKRFVWDYRPTDSFFLSEWNIPTECAAKLGRIEFTLTDGKLTDVKILES